jgi:hypothetical protein
MRVTNLGQQSRTSQSMPYPAISSPIPIPPLIPAVETPQQGDAVVWRRWNARRRGWGWACAARARALPCRRLGHSPSRVRRARPRRVRRRGPAAPARDARRAFARTPCGLTPGEYRCILISYPYGPRAWGGGVLQQTLLPLRLPLPSPPHAASRDSPPWQARASCFRVARPNRSRNDQTTQQIQKLL